MKTLKFNTDDTEIYETIYTALLLSNALYKGPAVRLFAKMLDKYEWIGKLKDDSGLYTLNNPGNVQLEDAEYKLLREAFDNTDWRGLGGKQAARVYDFFDRNEKIDE